MAGQKPPTLLTHLAGPGSYVPAPPKYQILPGQIDPNLNQSGVLASAYADTANNAVHVQRDPDPFAVGHELGHLFDSQILGDGDRRYFQRLMHAPAGAWNLGETTGKVQGEISPNEWFGDYYGAMASGFDANHNSLGSFAVITPRRLHNFEAALARLGRRRGLQGLNLLDALASAR